MKTPAEILFKLRHAAESGTFAVLEPAEAAELAKRWARRESLLREARSAARSEPMSVRAYTPDRLASAIDDELAQ